jgi:hypothetical protein
LRIFPEYSNQEIFVVEFFDGLFLPAEFHLGSSFLSIKSRVISPFPIMLFKSIILSSSILAVYSHGLLTSPAAREGMNVEPGEKFTPRPPTPEQLNGCAGVPAGAPSETWVSGSLVNISWIITIPHMNPPGVRLAIQFEPEEDFISLAEGLDINLLTAEVQLPEGRTSENAVIQWLWDTEADNGFYMGCGDVRVIADTNVGAEELLPEVNQAGANLNAEGIMPPEAVFPPPGFKCQKIQV